MITLDDIRAAERRLVGRVHRTPLVSATRIGATRNVRLWLKCESLQKTGSFKVRGALNAVASLTPAQRDHGVIAVSAGNHAQALAWAAASAGVRATVVMPETASRAKVEASRGYGAEVVLFGASSIEAFARARELERERGLTFVHPFEDPRVVAGQGTVGLEILEELPDADVVVVPVGGGGLISGVVTAIKALRPATRVYGVEPTGAAVLRRSLDAGSPQQLDRIDTFADGLSAPMAAPMTFDVVRRLVDDVVLVSDAEIGEAMRTLLSSAKLLAEGAGAAATAAILQGRIPLHAEERVVSIVSGGNVDLSLVAKILGG